MVQESLQPGEHSPIEVAPYRREKGKRVRVASKRQATLWRARSRYCNLDGTRVDLTRWGTTRDEATQAVEEALLVRTLKDAPDGAAILTPSSKFIQAGELWLDWIKRPEAQPRTGGLAERTKREYRDHYYRHIDATGSPLRGRTIAQVNDPQRLILFLQAVADSSGTASSKMSRTVLSGILALCLRRGVIQINFARTIGAVSASRPMHVQRDRKRAFTREEREAVIAYADSLAILSRNPRTKRRWEAVADLMAFMAGTGCRINEARLVRWDDVDLKAGRVRIHGTKTLSSDRVNTLPAWLRARLRSRRRTMSSWKHPGPFVFSLGWPREEVLPNGLLRYGEDNVPPGDANLTKWVRTVLDGAGYPWAVPHTFRRTVATLLHEAGMPLVDIADQLGHADPAMTMSVYLGRDLQGEKSAHRRVL